MAARKIMNAELIMVNTHAFVEMVSSGQIALKKQVSIITLIVNPSLSLNL